METQFHPCEVLDLVLGRLGFSNSWKVLVWENWPRRLFGLFDLPLARVFNADARRRMPRMAELDPSRTAEVVGYADVSSQPPRRSKQSLVPQNLGI